MRETALRETVRGEPCGNLFSSAAPGLQNNTPASKYWARFWCRSQTMKAKRKIPALSLSVSLHFMSRASDTKWNQERAPHHASAQRRAIWTPDFCGVSLELCFTFLTPTIRVFLKAPAVQQWIIIISMDKWGKEDRSLRWLLKQRAQSWRYSVTHLFECFFSPPLSSSCLNPTRRCISTVLKWNICG